MAHAVSRRPPTAETRLRSRISPCGIYGGQIGTGRGFSPQVLRFSPVNFIPPVLHYLEKWKNWSYLSSSSLRLRCVRSFCCGALLKKIIFVTFWVTNIPYFVNNSCALVGLTEIYDRMHGTDKINIHLQASPWLSLCQCLIRYEWIQVYFTMRGKYYHRRSLPFIKHTWSLSIHLLH